jgi:tripartite-type tricarboxylate transporter receptor subunit TctC
MARHHAFRFHVAGRRTVVVLGAALIVASLAAESAAQVWPSRPVRLVIGQPPGSGVDNAARVLAKALGDQWSESVVVESRLGAAGTIAVEAVAQAAPDGYTLLVAAPPNVVIPTVVNRDLRFDPVRDFVPIGRIAQAPYAIAVGPQVPARNMRELVELARAKPGALTYTSAGPGSLTEFNMGLLSAATGIKLTPIEYKSLANATVDLVAGRIDISVNDYDVFASHAAAGNLRVVGIIGTKRASRAPDVPTVAEQGFPTTTIGLWYGLLAPAHTPPDVLARIRAGYEGALRSSELRERIAAFGYELIVDAPGDFAAVIRDDLKNARSHAPPGIAR